MTATMTRDDRVGLGLYNMLPSHAKKTFLPYPPFPPPDIPVLVNEKLLALVGDELLCTNTSILLTYVYSIRIIHVYVSNIAVLNFFYL